MNSYQEILEFAHSLAEKASELILAASATRWTSRDEAGEKKNSVDLVTETDRAVEDMIKAAIAERYPEHRFIGEESYDAGDRTSLTDQFTWIVDPVDGTMNPYVACSIGVTHNQRPVVGVIAMPFFNHIFSARLGGGAFLNRTVPLPLTGGIPQPLTSLSKAMIGAEWGSDRTAATFSKKANSFMLLAGDPAKGVEGGIMAHALRTTGSTACNIASVAAGQLDLYWDAGCYSWDVTAGAVILGETGGFFSGGKAAFHGDAAWPDLLMGRRYIFVRALPDSADETTLQIQRRLVSEFYDVVEEWTNEDMQG